VDASKFALVLQRIITKLDKKVHQLCDRVRTECRLQGEKPFNEAEQEQLQNLFGLNHAELQVRLCSCPNEALTRTCLEHSGLFFFHL
jgi:hypothetical protein